MIVPMIQVRMDSERLPGKAMLEIGETPLFGYVADACWNAGFMPIIITPIAQVNNPIVTWCKENDFKHSCWPVPDVRDPLAEFAYAARDLKDDDWIIRLTGDCPMIKPHHVSLFASMLSGSSIFTNRPTDKDGYDLEGFRVSALRAAFIFAKGEDREHVCPWMYRNLGNPIRFSVMGNPNDGVTEGKVSVDTQAEFDYVKALMEASHD